MRQATATIAEFECPCGTVCEIYQRMLLGLADTLRRTLLAPSDSGVRNALSPNHQGLGNRLIVSDLVAKTSGTIRRRERLGGMPNYYYRASA